MCKAHEVMRIEKVKKLLEFEMGRKCESGVHDYEYDIYYVGQ